MFLKFLVVLSALCYGLTGWTESSYAAVSLSVTPIQGGSGIRFDRVLPGMRNTQEVRIRVSSNGDKQFQVYQRVQEPITNQKGQSLNLSAVEMASLPNSNTSGTLYLQNVDHLSYSDQLVYTSGAGGESDSFTIAYNAVPERLNDSGSFRGRVVFTVRTLGGEQSESLVDFYLENEAQLKTTIEGSRDRAVVHIKNEEQSRSEFIHFSFSGNGSREINIIQEVVSFLSNEMGEDLPADLITLNLQGTNTANLRTGETGISRSKTLLYSGNADADEFGLYFKVDAEKAKQVNAGIYKGQIKYTIEAGGSRQEVVMNVEYEVPPIFTIDVTLPPEGVLFGRVLPTSPAQERQVAVVINTNIHKPYQVSQNMASLMTNEKGKEFDKKYFTFQVDLSKTQKGRTPFAEDAPVDAGDYPIYYSDAKGSPVTFYVNYKLRSYPEMDSGNFVAPIKYTLNQN